MKHLIALVSFCITVLNGYSQDNLFTIGEKLDGTELKATSYTLSKRVDGFSVDPASDCLYLYLRETTKNGKYLKNKGLIALYDVADTALVWTVPIDYSRTRVSCTKDGLLLTTMNEVSFYDRETGNKCWEQTLYPVYRDDSLNILLGYKSATSKKLKAVSLTDGTELWETKVSHEYGWDQVYTLDHAKRLVVADDILELDLLTGNSLAYKAKTGVQDVKSMVLQGLVAVATGVATGVASGGAFTYGMIPTGNNVISGLVSNVWMQDSCYYVADRENMICLDKELQPVWKHEFPGKTSSSSTLFIQNDHLYMLNYGFGLKNGGYKVKCGRPFIAGFDCKSGEELFFNRLSLKKDMVEDAFVTQDAVYMLFDDGLAYQELTDSVVNIAPWNTEKYGKLQGLLYDTLYVFNPERKEFMPLAFDGVNCPVYTDEGKVYVIDKDLQIKQEYPSDLLYGVCFTLDDYLCVRQGDDYWLLHKLGLPVAHFQMNMRQGAVIGNQLLILTEYNHLLYIDLDKALM